MDIVELSSRFGVHAERGRDGNFPQFINRMARKHILLLADENTEGLCVPLAENLRAAGAYLKRLTYPCREPIADEATVAAARSAAEGCDYLLAAGAGTLNDIAKYVGSQLNKPSGVFATAPSMDGFTSGVAPLIHNGFKVTYPAQVVSDILMDDELLSRAPRLMIGAGVGDILAKYCCLTDWKISSALTGEEYDARAAALMYEALHACNACIPALVKGEVGSTRALMEALLVSGYAMVIAGNSRPASGAEHHMSHFLEMDFLRRGKPVPLHGVKVGLGTMVSLYLYHTLASRAPFDGCEAVYAAAQSLPESSYVEGVLASFGCPTRFSQLDVSRETVRDMLFGAYKIRDRFTVLTLYCTKGLMKDAADEILERFY